MGHRETWQHAYSGDDLRLSRLLGTSACAFTARRSTCFAPCSQHLILSTVEAVAVAPGVPTCLDAVSAAGHNSTRFC